MEWADELRQFRVEVDSLRLERARQIQLEEAEHQQMLGQLKESFENLQIPPFLEEMNRQLLDGQGKVALYLPWDSEAQPPPEASVDEEDEEGDELEEEDVASVILSWEDDGEREVAVDVGFGEDGVYLQVNGKDVRLREDALREALKRALCEELEL